MIKAIIFDFDGVILESNHIKDDAFMEIAKDYSPRQACEFMDYHKTHMGLSRYVKFRYLVEKILGKQFSAETGKILAERFSELVHKKILSCEFVPGAQAFLENYHKRYDLFIASGTPEEEMREIVNKRGMSPFFLGVYGSPKSKEQIIRTILRDYRYFPEETLFVGDASTDQLAAWHEHLIFVGRNTPDNANDFRSERYTIDNLSELKRICESL